MKGGPVTAGYAPEERKLRLDRDIHVVTARV